jgi:hypothetical protein
MNAIFKKLNFKDQKLIYVVNAPESFQRELDDMASVTEISANLAGAKPITFFLAFVIKQSEIDKLVKQLVPKVGEDPVIWFAYPKGTSKNYKCDFNRDTGWTAVWKAGYEGVRMVAIDDDWSALRFRQVENIKTMKRKFAMTKTGKAKTDKRDKK